MGERLNGKVVIVTGGTRGMGEAEVRGLVAEGAKVVFGGRDEAAGARIQSELGEAAMFASMDVGEESDWERVVGIALDRFGGLHGLVNNAGRSHVGKIADMTLAEMDALYRTNQLGVLLGLKHVVGPFRANGAGSIVNIGSVCAVKGHFGTTAYSGTKAAIIGITRASAIELAGRQIRVNCVHPGFFATELLASATDGRGADAGVSLTPMKRTAQPDEIVGIVTFLLSDESRFITGAQFSVDGGYSA